MFNLPLTLRAHAIEMINANHKVGYLEDHLLKVETIATKYMYLLNGKYTESQVSLSALLHDIVEDTEITEDNLGIFGGTVQDTVERVTDEDGANRKERKLKTYPKIRGSVLATYIKLCDRLANVERRGKLDMYRKEHAEFRTALYRKGEFEDLWNAIETVLNEEVTH